MKLLAYMIGLSLIVVLRKNRHVWMLAAVILSMLTLMTSEQADFQNYEWYFNTVRLGITTLANTSEPLGWYFLCLVFGTFGFTYHGMVLAVEFLGVFLTHVFVKRFEASNNGIFWLCFLIFPALVCCVQVRFFLAQSIVMAASAPLFTSANNRKSYIILTTGIIVASAIHQACMVYAVLALIPYLAKNANKVRTVFMVLVLMICLYVGWGELQDFASVLTTQAKSNRYFGTGATESSLGWVVTITIVWISFCVVTFILYENTYKITAPSADMQVLRRLFLGTLLLGICIPLLRLDESFHRYLEVAAQYCYMATAISMSFTPNVVRNRSIVTLCGLLLIPILIFAFQAYIPFEGVVRPLLMSSPEFSRLLL